MTDIPYHPGYDRSGQEAPWTPAPGPSMPNASDHAMSPSPALLRPASDPGQAPRLTLVHAPQVAVPTDHVRPVFSSYQEDIFKFHVRDTRDGFVDAKAGSGKTATIVECASRLSRVERRNAVFVAFNKHVADEIARRLPDGPVARTVHSIGREALERALGRTGNWRAEPAKAIFLTRIYLDSAGIDPHSPQGRDLTAAITALLHFVMVTLADPRDRVALATLADRYGVVSESWELVAGAIPVIIAWGIDGVRFHGDAPMQDSEIARDGEPSGIAGDGEPSGIAAMAGRYSLSECVSFDEMLFLPHYLKLDVPKSEMIYCDEAQDLSPAQREIVLGMRAPSGRILFVADPNQAIYGFAGADCKSVDAILERTRAVRLSLPICYRCPRSHVELARRIVPGIEARPSAPEGIVSDIPEALLAGFVRPGDLVLCRTTAPLIASAFRLIEAGRPARVRGREIGAGLIALADAAAGTRGYTYARFAESVEIYRSRLAALYRQREFSEVAIDGLNDKAESLLAVYYRRAAQGRARTLDELKAGILELFSDRHESVTLCTVHRAKGLEADRVFIHEEENMPHPKATRPHEVEQEWNLRYVALTRARQALYFIRK